MTTHNGACNHGMTGECAACDYERATAMANLRIDLGNARAEIAQLRTERDEARADALALATERNNWQSMYQDAMAERDKALARVAELEAQQLRHAPCGPLGYATWEEYRKDNPVPLCDRIDAALCQIALAAAEHERVRSTVVAERARNAGEYDAAINAMLQSRADLVAAIADAGLLTTAPQETQP